MAIYLARGFARWANYGFAKSDQEDVEPADIEGFRIWANEIVELPLHKLLELQERGSIKRIDYDA